MTPFVRSSSSVISAANGTSVVVPAPASQQPGDIMIAAIACGNGPTVVPAGWIQILSDIDAGLTIVLYVYYKIVQPVETATYTWTLGGSAGFAAGILCMAGVSAVEAWGSSSNAVAPTCVAPGITPITSNSYLLGIFAQPSRTAYSALTPTGGTNVIDVHSSGGSAVSACLSTFYLLPTPPYTGIATAGESATADASADSVCASLLLTVESDYVSVVSVPTTRPGVTADYQVWLRSPAGSLLLTLDDWLSLSYGRIGNNVGGLQLTLPNRFDAKKNLSLADLFVEDSRIEVWRCFPGRSPYLDGQTQYFVRKVVADLNESGEQILTIEAPDSNYLLSGKSVLLVGDVDNFTQVTALASDGLLSLLYVLYVRSAQDLLPGNDISAYIGPTNNLSIAPVITKSFGFRRVIDVMREVADYSANAGTYLGFDMVATSPGVNPQLALQVFTQWRGSDHCSPQGYRPVTLDPDAGSLLSIELGTDWADEVTLVYVGGEGDGSRRLVSTRYDTSRIVASPFARRDLFKDARQDETVTAMNADGDSEVRAGRPRQVFTARVNQIPGCLWGLHYGFGDAVSVNYRNTRLQCRVDGFQTSLAQGKETIDLMLRQDPLLV